MAQFCTKCGTALPEGMKFCLGCGAPVPDAAAPITPGPLAQPPVAPMAPTPMAAEPRLAPVAPAAAAPSKGSPVLKIVLIVVAVLIFFGVLSAGACVYFVYRAKQRVSQLEKQVQSSLPVSTDSTQVPASPDQTASVVDMAIPPYPGATVLGERSQLMGVAGFKVQQYVTTDSVDNVLAFYRDKLGPKAMVTQSGNQASLHVVRSNAVVNIAITVDKASGKTKITITSIGRQ